VRVVNKKSYRKPGYGMRGLNAQSL